MCESETAVLPKSGAHCWPSWIVVLPLLNCDVAEAQPGVGLLDDERAVGRAAVPSEEVHLHPPPAFQSPKSLGPSKTRVSRVFRTSPPPNQQSTSHCGPVGHSAFCPLPNVKF